MEEQARTGAELAVEESENVEVPCQTGSVRTLAAIGSEIREHAARFEYHKRATVWEAVEIGRRLTEARDKAAHGEWADFLTRETGYSRKIANNFIRVFEAYGDRQTALLENNSEVLVNTYSHLSYSQALALLAIPEDQREQFMAEKPVEDMSVRELKEAIRREREAREAAEQERDETQKELNEERQDSEGTALRIAELEGKLDAAEEKREDMAEKLERAKANAANAEESRAEMERQMQTLQGVHEGTLEELRELRNKPVDVAVERVVDEEAIEAARADERKKMENELRMERFNAQEAQKARNEMKEELDTAKSEVNDLRATVGEMKKKEKQVRKEVQEQYEEDMAELHRQLEEAQAAAKGTSGGRADDDMAAFKVIFEQVQGQINQLHGLVMKISGRGDTDTAQRLRNALTALSDAVARVAKGEAA